MQNLKRVTYVISRLAFRPSLEFPINSSLYTSSRILQYTYWSNSSSSRAVNENFTIISSTCDWFSPPVAVSLFFFGVIPNASVIAMAEDEFEFKLYSSIYEFILNEFRLPDFRFLSNHCYACSDAAWFFRSLQYSSRKTSRFHHS